MERIRLYCKTLLFRLFAGSVASIWIKSASYYYYMPISEHEVQAS